MLDFDRSCPNPTMARAVALEFLHLDCTDCMTSEYLELRDWLTPDAKGTVTILDADHYGSGGWGTWRESYDDTNSYIIFLVSPYGYDGKKPFFVTGEEASDSTGHGCQCSSTWKKFDTLDEAVALGLNEDDRRHYLARVQPKK